MKNRGPMTETMTQQEAKLPVCEVGQCVFPAVMNLGGKWVCQHHAPAEASYYKKYGKPYREAAFADAERKEKTNV